MKKFKSCPRCGRKGVFPKYRSLAIVNGIYHCSECKVDFCFDCSGFDPLKHLFTYEVCPICKKCNSPKTIYKIGYYFSGSCITSKPDPKFNAD